MKKLKSVKIILTILLGLLAVAFVFEPTKRFFRETSTETSNLQPTLDNRWNELQKRKLHDLILHFEKTKNRGGVRSTSFEANHA